MSWQRLVTLLRREVRATLRDPFTVTMLILVPLGALLLFGFTMSTGVHDLAVGVRDESRTVASRRLLAELEAEGDFRLRPYSSREAIDHALVAGEISAAVVIPATFDRLLRDATPGAAAAEVQLLYDGAETVVADNAEAYLHGLIAASVAELSTAPQGGSRDSERPDAGDGTAPRGIAVVAQVLFNPTLDGVPYMVAGTFGFVLTFLTTLITAVSVVNERLQGTFDQLQVTPATSLEIFLGKVLPLGGVFTVDVVLMVLAAGVFMHVWPSGSALFFVAVSSYYVLVSLALGLIISATSATPAEAVQKTVLTSIPLVQLSGFVFPIRNMPMLVQWLAEVFPATHYIRVSRAIYLRGAGPLDLLPELALLAVFGAVLLLLALRSIEARA
jgi:ABC-2 type transport system permease protein